VILEREFSKNSFCHESKTNAQMRKDKKKEKKEVYLKKMGG